MKWLVIFATILTLAHCQRIELSNECCGENGWRDGKSPWEILKSFMKNPRIVVPASPNPPAPVKKPKLGPLMTMFPKNLEHPADLTEDNAGKPLFLTPLIEAGKIDEAKDLARVHNLSDIESYSGFLTVNPKYNSNLFFWFVPSKFNENAPLVLWLQGGPGGSSLFGLFVENGPYSVDENLNLKPRSTAWSLPYNVLYIDQPAGTGFSFTDDDRGYAKNQFEVANDLYEAMKQFYRLFPKLQAQELYVTGESYAGKYVPAISYKIHKMNKMHTSLKMNLAGLAIGDGLVDPLHQLDYGDFLYQVGLLDDADRDLTDERTELARISIQNEQWKQASAEFSSLLEIYNNRTGLTFYYNYLLSKQPDEFDNYPKLLQKAEVRKAIHVGNLTYDGISMTVHEHLDEDMTKSVKPWLEVLLENYKVMVYSGQLDVIIAFPQTENMLNNLEWSGKYVYANAPRMIWNVDGDIAGYVREAKNLIQVMVRNAGHILPYDQPKWAFDMIQRFIAGKSFSD